MNNNKKYVHWKTIKNYQFTDKQLELVIGSMLGDAMLEKVATCQSRFVENHSYIQKGWLDYKGKILEPFSKSAKTIKSMGRKRQANKIVYDFSKEYKGCKLRTMRHPIFTELEYKWYRRDKQGNYVLRKVLVSSAIPDMPACMQYKLNPFTPMKNTHKAVNFL
jgi:hypothetical protein